MASKKRAKILLKLGYTIPKNQRAGWHGQSAQIKHRKKRVKPTERELIKNISDAQAGFVIGLLNKLVKKTKKTMMILPARPALGADEADIKEMHVKINATLLV